MKKKAISLIVSTFIMLGSVACSSSIVDSKNDKGSTLKPNYTITEKGEPVKYCAQSFDAIGGEDVMPICGFFGPYIPHTPITNCNNWPDYFSDDIFEKITDCGVNMIVQYNTTTEYCTNKILEMCDKYNMGVYAYDKEVAEFIGNSTGSNPYGTEFDYDAFTKKILGWNTHKSFCGIHTLDEPFTININEKNYILFATHT